MSEAAILVIINNLPAILTAIGALIVVIRQNYVANKKLDHITVLTNSTLTTANEKIASLEAVLGLVQEKLGAKPGN